MATTIKLKNGSGAPTTGDLVQGEPAFDLTNKRLYTEDSGGTVIEVGTNPTSLTTGTFTSTGIDDNATSTAITIDASENVGIGTASPTSTASAGPTLEISGTAGGNLVLSDSNATTGQRAKYLLSQGGALYVGHSADNGTSPVNDLVIDSSGNVGIGTTSPSSQNSVFKEVIGSSSDSNSGSVLVSSSAGSGWLGWNDAESATIPAYIKYDHSTNSMQFQANSAERMRIDSSGNVGIGTTSPIAKLNVEDTSGDDNGFYVFKNGRSSSKNYSSADMSASSICWIQAQENNTSLANTLVMRQYDAAVAISALYDTTNTGSLAFGTNNGSASVVERMRIDSSGNVGIGTSSPGSYSALGSSKHFVVSSGGTTTMTIHSGTTNYGHLAFADGTASVNDQYRGLIQYYHTDNSMRLYTNAAERMRIDSSGNLGIGTSSPTVRLQIGDATVNASNILKFGKTQTAAQSTLPYIRQISESSAGTSNDLELFAGGSGAGRIILNSYDFVVKTGGGASPSGAERMRIDSSGNVGIGLSTPALNVSYNKILHVHASAGLGSLVKITDSSTGSTSNDGSDFLQYGVDLYLLNRENGTMRFSTNAAEAMRIDSGGNLLVGITSAISGTNPAKQYVFNNTASQTCFQATAGASHTGIYALGAFSTVQASSGSNVALVVQSGNGSTVTANNFYVYTNGDVKNTNNSYGAISDERLKSNIVDASSQIDDIMAVQVRSYTLDSTGDTHIGVVAQELEASGMSGLVQEDEEGMKSVKYSILYMKAIKALQEAVTRIETLEAEVAALKGE